MYARFSVSTALHSLIIRNPTAFSHSCDADLPAPFQQVFLNIVLDEAVEEKAGGEKVRIGMVVCTLLRNPVVFDRKGKGKED